MESIKYKGYEIKISQDECGENPREWDNVGTMVCFHKRYDLGDKDHGVNKDDFNSWDEVEKHLRKELNAVIVLPLYLYDHGSLRMKVGSFQGLLPQGHAEFDSGVVGFIFVSAEKVRKEYSVKRISKKTMNRVAQYLTGEIKTYDEYLSGAVYGYQVESDGLDESCWGFYGNDYEKSGLLDEARAAIDYDIKMKIEAEIAYNLLFAI